MLRAKDTHSYAIMQSKTSFFEDFPLKFGYTFFFIAATF